MGFKPSFGAISKEGAHPLSYSLDHIGFFTRSVDDVAYAFQLLKDDNLDSSQQAQASNSEKSPRIALIKTPFDHLMSAEQQAVMESSIQKIRTSWREYKQN